MRRASSVDADLRHRRRRRRGRSDTGPVRCMRGPGISPRSIDRFMLISWYGEVPPVVRMVVTPLAEVEPRRGELELHAAAARRVERVVVHADEAGDHGVAGRGRSSRAPAGTRASRPGATAVILPFSITIVWSSSGALAGAVDDAHVRAARRAVSGTLTNCLHGRRERAEGLRAERDRDEQRRPGAMAILVIGVLLTAFLGHLEHHPHARLDVLGDVAVQHPLAGIRQLEQHVGRRSRSARAPYLSTPGARSARRSPTPPGTAGRECGSGAASRAARCGR